MMPNGPQGILHAFDLSAWYAASPHTFDALIYLVIFTGVARVTLGRMYHGRGGRAIVIGVGLSLTVAATVSSVRSGFTLDRLAPISWIVLGTLLAILVLALLSTASRWRARSTGTAQQDPAGSPLPGGRSYSFHLHTDRMPDPSQWGWWGRRSSSSSSSEAPSPTGHAAESVRAAETTVARLLEAFAEHVHLHGLDHHPESFLIAIARTQRAVEQSYHHLLKLLARSGWRCDPDKHQLAGDVESAIQRVARNTALFHEAMRFAEAAIHGGNLQLLTESIAQMQQLEHDSIRLTAVLEALIGRLLAEHPSSSSSSSSSSRASVPTRGRDAG